MRKKPSEVATSRVQSVDFRNGVRGKYYERFRSGPVIVQPDGAVARVFLAVTLRVPGTSDKEYKALFLVDTGATDSMAPASECAKVGLKPVGRTAYELADGSVHEFDFALAQVEFMGEITAGRVILGPDSAAPILGVTALESVGITIDPATRSLKRR